MGWLLLGNLVVSAQSTVKRVVLQGFWWDYYNANYSTSGTPYASASRFVNQSWELTPTTTGAIINATLQWPAAAESAAFQGAAARAYHHDNSSGT